MKGGSLLFDPLYCATLVYPLPPKLQEGLVAKEDGALDIAAMQNQVTGLYCFPRAKQQELDSLLDNTYKRGDFRNGSR